LFNKTLELDKEGVFCSPAKQYKLKIDPRAGNARIVRVKVMKCERFVIAARVII